MTDEQVKEILVKSVKAMNARTENSKLKWKKPRKVFNKKTRSFED